MRLRDTKVYMRFLAEVRGRVENGTAMPCVAAYGLNKQEQWGLSDVELAYACSAPWQAGGASVSWSSLVTINFLA